ncbi:hypothetical protein PSYJA_44631, partial [Pseudomonas syringae pv. japonica str. M301072]
TGRRFACSRKLPQLPRLAIDLNGMVARFAL